MDINKESELYQFEKLYQTLFLNHPDAIYLLDLEGNFMMVNEEVCRITGYGREMLIGQNFEPLIDESMRAFTRDRFLESMQDKPQRYETAIISKNGFKYLDVTNFPLKDEDRVMAIFGIAKDVTEKKHKEIELENYTALLKVQNDELEIFRKILAHDMRKPVANALGFARLLQSSLPDNKETELKRYLLHTVESIDVMLRDLNELIALQSTGKESKEEVDVVKTIKRIFNFYQGEIRQSGAFVELEMADKIVIHTIKAYLNSILRNLISNALKYRSPNRQTIIRVSALLHDEFITIQVQDNGIGMDLVRIGKDLFQMHRRFAPKVAEGNGLGLYIVNQQVKLMGGQISLDSELDKGSTFTVTLPNC
ncbi:PAS domain-containing sensor histidine kinase [Pontibacter sp. HSC-14F20]|uniref:sensor histidine kinase n=1 Tax=Pontibacter sp. HSC-14F20 TaxID=2864136 RepID=UPI001C72CE6E|nr:PAS domain-containing sensor histidine kinase [Pontibacter sp. HSC-14F20]MBX0335023.1 PAS domain-containing sensor histidine kinase [Pontibacter sp. HSC-14F20]